LRRAAVAAAMLCAASLTACDSTAPPLASSGTDDRTAVSASPLRPATPGGGTSSPLSLANAARQPSGPPVIEMGTGRFIGPVSDQSQIQPRIAMTGPDVTLDFAGVDVRDVARSVLGGLLHVSYVVDPALQAAVTLQTGQPIPRNRVLPVLADALQASGVALVQRDGVYQLVPIASAAREATLGGGAAAGYVTRAVTPQFVSATDLQHVLEPLLPPGTTAQADPSRNLLIITGTDTTVADILRDVSTFDVDYLRGMSFALLPLKNAQARDVAKEVTTLLGNGRGAIGGLVSISAIDRLNAVLVTAMQPSYLTRVRAWVDRLDRGGTGTDQRLYVYRVQNGRASDLASVLRRALGLESPAATSAGGSAAAGSYASRLGNDLTGGGGGGGFGQSSSGDALGRAPAILLGALPGTAAEGAQPAAPGQAGVAPSQGGQPATGPASANAAGTEGEPNGIRITADEVNNALVIAATPDEYARIAAALQQLDITPLQVAIDATIAEADLTNELSYGLQYYIQAGNFHALLSNPSTSTTNTTTTTTTTATNSGPLSVFQGFNYIPGLNVAVTSASGSAVILQALSDLTRVQVLSSPNLLVLNNQPARIQVGDQVPVATSSAVSTAAPNAPQVNTIEYRDTGVILSITPRVNASGLVLLDIAEEVSNPTSTTTSTISSPTISQRRVTSSVAVSDGQTIAIGGLIQDSRTKSKNGVPFLQDVPVLGWLFGTHSTDLTRTELIVLITPHVVRNSWDANAITQELQRKLPLTLPVVKLGGGGG
jgi:general secretion pathway protein D